MCGKEKMNKSEEAAVKSCFVQGQTEEIPPEGNEMSQPALTWRVAANANAFE